VARVLKRDTFLQRRYKALQEELSLLESNIRKTGGRLAGERNRLCRRRWVLPAASCALTYWVLTGGSFAALLVFLLVFLVILK